MPTQLQQAVTAYQQGDLKGAGQLCTRHLKKAPQDHFALNLLALIENRKGRGKVALKTMHKAIQLAPNEPAYHNNLGEILRTDGALSDAEASYRKALSLRPDYPQAQSNLGIVLAEQGENDKAEALLREVVERHPDTISAWYNLGVIYTAVGDSERAETCYRKLLALMPEHGDAANNLATLLRNSNREDEAAELLLRVINRDETNTIAMVSLGEILLNRRNFIDAIRLLQRLVSTDPGNCTARLHLAHALTESDRHEEAITTLQNASDVCRNSALWLANMGHAAFRSGKLEEGLEQLEMARSKEPTDSDISKLLADSYLDQGRMEEALAIYRAILKNDPGYIPAYIQLSQAMRFTEASAPEIAAMQGLLDSPGLNDHQRIPLNFALGKAFDDLHDIDRAFSYYREGNRLRSGQTRFDIEQFRELINILIDRFQAPTEPPSAGVSTAGDARPVFIVGMPRSGTTLLHQILAAHPEVRGAGELTYLTSLVLEQCSKRHLEQCGHYLSRFDREVAVAIGHRYLEQTQRYRLHGNRFFVDKMPSNFFLVGLIREALPEAKIIHCSRDPIDTCLSIYRQNFAGHHPYSHDLEHLGLFYREYQRLMAHWHTVFGDELLKVSYEQVVEDQHGETTRMLDFIGLSHDPACIEFHKSASAIHTASVAQARQPIYRSSVAGWKRYADHLTPLLAALGMEE